MHALGRRPLLGAGLCTIFVSKLAKAQRATRGVHTALCAAADTSGSVDGREYVLQNKGLARALVQDSVRETLDMRGALAFSLTEFDTVGYARIPWRVVQTQGDLEALSREIDAIARRRRGSTYVDVGMDFALQTMMACGVDARHRVIDMSGDEFFEHTQGRCQLLKLSAEDEGIRINTLPIIELPRSGLLENMRQSENDRLVRKFTTEVQTMDGFTEVATGFEAFGDSMARKLRYELRAYAHHAQLGLGKGIEQAIKPAILYVA